MLLSKVYPSRTVNASKNLMTNAITMEQGETFAKHLGSKEKQFNDVKVKLTETIEKLKVTPPYSSNASFFDSFLMVIPICNSTTCLMDVVDSALEQASSLDKPRNENS